MTVASTRLLIAAALLAASPAIAQPAPPNAPGGGAGPANPGHPLLAGSATAEQRKACHDAWRAESARTGRSDSASYLRFLQECLEPK